MLNFVMFSVIALVFIIVGISCYLTHYFLIELPNKQLSIINHFVPCIINQVAME